MSKHASAQVTCQICHRQVRRADAVPGELVHPAVVTTIERQHHEWTPTGFICLSDLHRFRIEHVREVLEIERGELTALESEVLKSLATQETVAKDINTRFDRTLTFGERLADRVAEFGGSWTFVTLFGLAVLGWIVVNTWMLGARPPDPFPYILLNLCLSCLAAIQAPIIMMSQNRQEAKDRLRSEQDYRVDLKAELEVRQIITRLDQLLSHQWQRLLEIQELQLESIAELARQRERKPG
ncbi:MAG: DUF1003 domain-containing protein [Pirellulales bacterium]|nr:DUF1003 domain-containing protein [Pirellulales bacterium]